LAFISDASAPAIIVMSINIEEFSSEIFLVNTVEESSAIYYVYRRPIGVRFTIGHLSEE